ncbi:hypothetical protein WOLCODRAFT_152080 [Wolfiporia cocos MD-104 SS10]|uniref:Uncharacterized protein n=1 Tax=Wolfiporia cocos (strain MD-104) TaxID=742152 RepID=A0A2H3JQ51_WOLCO|nr:hypothetical protein WOLCODRAFT_152080 [Wolfiporia cocos MD-104 SS10]
MIINVIGLNTIIGYIASSESTALLDGLSPRYQAELSGLLDHLRALLKRGQPNAGNGNAMGAFQQNPSTFSTSNLPPPKTLTCTCLPEPMQLREMMPLAISHVLMELPSLTSRRITFPLHSGYDSTGVLRTIVASCPQLLDLDLPCICKPSFLLLHPSFDPHLRLTIVRQLGEELMHVGATRIALSNSRLTRFLISYIPAHTPALPRPAQLEKGSFELVCDQQDLPINLLRPRLVSEWHASLGSSGDNLVSRALIAASMVLRVGGGSSCGHPDVRKIGRQERAIFMHTAPANTILSSISSIRAMNSFTALTDVRSAHLTASLLDIERSKEYGNLRSERCLDENAR